MKKFAIAAVGSLALLASVNAGFAQGAGDASGTGVTPNGTAPGAAGPYNTQIGSGRSVSTGGENAVDVMSTEPAGAENQQR